MSKGLVMVTIYAYPRDYPNEVVARWFKVTGEGTDAAPVPTETLMFFQTVDEALNHFERLGMMLMVRSPEDEPHIVGTFL